MADENKVSDLIKSTSDAANVVAPNTLKEADGALSTVVGFFNNVVLYPIKKANLSFRYKLEAFEEDLKEKVKDIPLENMQVPPAMIAGPTLEALRYQYDEEELREMYENLLASSMDNRNGSKVHPSFVSVLKQMSPLDSYVFKQFAVYHEFISATVEFRDTGTSEVYRDFALPEYYIRDIYSKADPLDISVSIYNLSRLGLISILEGVADRDYAYGDFLMTEYILSIKKKHKSLGRFVKADVVSKQIIRLNGYGKRFADVCVRIPKSLPDYLEFMKETGV